MIDTEKRNPGKYQDKYSKIINGVKVQIKEETHIGRDYEILGFFRAYDPAIPFVPKNA